MSNNTIEIKINSGGTLEVVTIPVKLYKDSYKAVKLRVKVPKVDGATLKVYGSDRDEAGEEVWTTSAYPLWWQKDVEINSQEYSVYEEYIPEEFCQKNGELYLTFSLGLMNEDKWVSIITSGTLNLYVSGEGFNYAGVEIPESDKLAYKINHIFENNLNINNTLDEISQNLENVNEKLNGIQENAEENVQSDWLQEDNLADDFIKNKPNVMTTDTQQTITASKIFNDSIKIAPDKYTSFNFDKKDLTQRISADDSSVSLMQLHDSGFGVIRYSENLGKTRLLGVTDEGVTIQTQDNTLVLDENGLKYNGQLVATKDDISNGEVSLANYYTKQETYSRKEVDTKIAEIKPPDVDLSNYYTKSEVDNKISDTSVEIVWWED